MSSGKICPTAPISHDGLKAVPGRSRLCSFRNQVLPTGDSSCVYEAIENGLAEMDGSNLKGRIVELKRIRDAARADADRAENRGEGDDNGVTPELLRRFGGEARKKIRDRERGFRPSPPGAR
jgi:hypothetical protein